ncbi:MAG TPA: type II toxin-antitoxin system VapC family toxin [Acidobacteriaceae bacterium]|nr:type II toxin-antitoxin system VapC family toxin [Acidobacteriaceae bacterium]
MRLLFDTVVFIRALKAPELLSKRAVSLLFDPGTICELSTISISEMAIKFAVGKLDLDREAAREGITDLQMRVLTWKADHAFHLFHLPLHHRDPFDRQLIAQAMAENIPVVTPAPKFRLYKSIQVIW